MILLLLLLLLELIERSWKLQSLKVLQDGLEKRKIVDWVGVCRFLRLHAGGGGLLPRVSLEETGSLKKGIRECPPKRENFQVFRPSANIKSCYRM